MILYLLINFYIYMFSDRFLLINLMTSLLVSLLNLNVLALLGRYLKHDEDQLK